MCVLLALPVRLFRRTQLLEKLLAGEPGGHQEFILGQEVVNELFLHTPGLEERKTGKHQGRLEEVTDYVNYIVPFNGIPSPYLSIQSTTSGS